MDNDKDKDDEIEKQRLKDKDDEIEKQRLKDKDDEIEKQRLILEENKQWKENTPFLYDLVITHVLEWPSLTVEWFPETEKPAGQDYAVQKVILGTDTCGQGPDYLMLAQVKLPLQDTEIGIQSLDLDRDRSEYGSSSGAANAKVQVTKLINHHGEVNRARFMPQNPSVIATRSPSGDVYLFNSREHPSKPLDGAFSPDLRLRGLASEGFGLSWSKFKEGHLLSGAYDSQICLWDTGATPNNKDLDALRTFKVNDAGVEDVAWHMKHDYLFGSVGDDKYLLIWDLRQPSAKCPVQDVIAHQKEVNCLAFNPHNEWILVTGSSDTTVKLFDLRKIGTPIHTFDTHKDEVFQVGWSPQNETILASSCDGRRVLVWDLSRIGEEQTPEDAAEGPPELLFIHGGHTSKIYDFSWNPCEDWIMASVAEDNIIQIWQMADHIYNDKDEDDLPYDNSPKDS